MDGSGPRMRAGKEHRLPLSAIAILEEVKPLSQLAGGISSQPLSPEEFPRNRMNLTWIIYLVK